jgi:hypothetical protein
MDRLKDVNKLALVVQGWTKKTSKATKAAMASNGSLQPPEVERASSVTSSEPTSSSDDRAPSISSTSSSTSPPIDPASRGEILCTFYVEGKCNRKHCPFKHDEPEREQHTEASEEGWQVVGGDRSSSASSHGSSHSRSGSFSPPVTITRRQLSVELDDSDDEEEPGDGACASSKQSPPLQYSPDQLLSCKASPTSERLNVRLEECGIAAAGPSSFASPSFSASSGSASPPHLLSTPLIWLPTPRSVRPFSLFSSPARSASAVPAAAKLQDAPVPTLLQRMRYYASPFNIGLAFGAASGGQGLTVAN